MPSTTSPGLRWDPQFMDLTEPVKEINHIERELDAINPPAGTPLIRRGGPTGGGPTGKPENSKSLDAVLVAALLLFAISTALVIAGQLRPNQRMKLTAGSIGGAVGLFDGYGIEKVRP